MVLEELDEKGQLADMHRCRIQEPAVGYRGMLSLEMFKVGLSEMQCNLLHSLDRKWLTWKFFLSIIKCSQKVKYLIWHLGFMHN